MDIHVIYFERFFVIQPKFKTFLYFTIRTTLIILTHVYQILLLDVSLFYILQSWLKI